MDQIRILNPRSRNKKGFAGLVENITSVGLKRPVTVVEVPLNENGQRYDLICGQGRYEALRAIGEQQIPCIVVTADESDRYLISLVENLARRKHSNVDLLNAVRDLEDRGYTVSQIAQKISLDPTYIRCILGLLKDGEKRLIDAVERGVISIDLAYTISKLGDDEVQKAMTDAYNAGTLRGDQLMQIRKLVSIRQKFGKGYGKWTRRGDKPSPKSLLRAYQAEVRRQQMIVKKADLNQQRMLFVTTALRRLMADENFRTLLRAEGINDMPKPLADQLRGAAL
jgi:ParB family chromosome partitioning protein